MLGWPRGQPMLTGHRSNDHVQGSQHASQHKVWYQQRELVTKVYFFYTWKTLMFKTITIPFLSLVEYRVNISNNYTHTGNKRFNARLVLCLNILMCHNWGREWWWGKGEECVYASPMYHHESVEQYITITCYIMTNNCM